MDDVDHLDRIAMDRLRQCFQSGCGIQLAHGFQSPI
jgi:hypothetical protein